MSSVHVGLNDVVGHSNSTLLGDLFTESQLTVKDSYFAVAAVLRQDSFCNWDDGRSPRIYLCMFMWTCIIFVRLLKQLARRKSRIY